jgi:hypothetical protein
MHNWKITVDQNHHSAHLNTHLVKASDLKEKRVYLPTRSIRVPFGCGLHRVCNSVTLGPRIATGKPPVHVQL